MLGEGWKDSIKYKGAIGDHTSIHEPVKWATAHLVSLYSSTKRMFQRQWREKTETHRNCCVSATHKRKSISLTAIKELANIINLDFEANESSFFFYCFKSQMKPKKKKKNLCMWILSPKKISELKKFKTEEEIKIFNIFTSGNTWANATEENSCIWLLVYMLSYWTIFHYIEAYCPFTWKTTTKSIQ